MPRMSVLQAYHQAYNRARLKGKSDWEAQLIALEAKDKQAAINRARAERRIAIGKEVI